MGRFSGLDSFFLSIETRTELLHVGGLLVLDPSGVSGGVDLAALADFVGQRISSAPELRRRVVATPGASWWPPRYDVAELDLGYHVRCDRLEAPGDGPALSRYAAAVMAEPLDRARPLFQIVLLDGLARGRIALLAKIHHAVIDGISAVGLASSVLAGSPVPLVSVSPLIRSGPADSSAAADSSAGPIASAGERESDRASSEPEAGPTGRALLEGAGEALFDRGFLAAKTVRQLVGLSLDVAAANLAHRRDPPPPAPFRAPRTVLNGALCSGRSVALSSLELEPLRAVRRAVGCTLNDVMLAMVSGALRRYLAAAGDLAALEPTSASLVALVPVAVDRAISGSRVVDGAANHVSVMLVGLASGLEDPIERLRTIAQGAARAKQQQVLIGPDGLSSWMEIVPPGLIKGLARLTGAARAFDHLPPAANIVVSNVPGPPMPLFLGPTIVEAIYPLGPVVEGIACNCTVFSYAGRIHVGLLAGKELRVPLEHLAHALETAADELVAALARSAGSSTT